jgi:DNA invertase Pin-like site-specific DNA recombinase
MNSSGTRPKRAAVYLRCSTESQHTENQRPDVERLVTARGFQVTHMFDENVSAAAKVRPEFDRMMGAAHRGDFEVLVVWSLDRLGRSMVGNLQAVLDLDRRGVQVVSVKESWLDSDIGPARQLLLGIMGWVAEQERVRVGQRVRAGLDRVKRSGVRLGRPKAVVNDRLVFNMKNEGRSVRDIAKALGLSASVVQRTLKACQKPDAEDAFQVAETR